MGFYGTEQSSPPHLRPAVDHAKVEFILVPPRGLLPELLYPVLLAVVVLCALDIVLVLLEDAQPLPRCRLRSLAVLPLLLVEAGAHRS